MNRRGLTLLEVLLSVVLLAAIVVACLPLLTPASRGDGLGRPDSALMEIAFRGDIALTNGQTREVPTTVGADITGSWRIIVTPSGYGLAWHPESESESP